jgi:hypothetical protein
MAYTQITAVSGFSCDAVVGYIAVVWLIVIVIAVHQIIIV